MAFEQQSYIATFLGRNFLYCLAEDTAFSFARFQVAVQYIDGCGFTCSVFPSNPKMRPRGTSNDRSL